MVILVFNSGSSSLKFEVVELQDGPAGPSELLVSGSVERIGGAASFHADGTCGRTEPRPLRVESHRDAARAILDWLRLQGHRLCPDAVGHRIVHGGSRFVGPARIDEAVLRELEPLSELAPLHNPGALQCIHAATDHLGPNVPMVAVFDTAFHASLPEWASTYALPAEWTQRRHLRRFGFHGLAHESMLLQYAEHTGTPAAQCDLVTLQLGNGCSAAAIAGGRSVDTSMGFTPLEGLIMGTRAGDLDPGLLLYLQRSAGVSLEELERGLNEEAGLRGLSGGTSDMRDLIARETVDPRAALAIRVFCYRARKYVGAYLAALGGADAVLFGGGIGEHAPEIRRRVLDDMAWCGLRLDPARNAAPGSGVRRISTDDSRLHAYVVPVDEAALIARRTAECVAGSRRAADARQLSRTQEVPNQ
jgi:acetate kinase